MFAGVFTIITLTCGRTEFSLSRYDTHFQIGADLELRYFFCYKKIAVTFEGNCLAESIKSISKSLLFPSACLRDAVSVKLYKQAIDFTDKYHFILNLAKATLIR